MHVLNRIIESEDTSYQTKTKACFVLCMYPQCESARSSSRRYILDSLVSDNRVFCQLAFERNSLAKVANLINSITPAEKSPESEEDEPESVCRLREVRFLQIGQWRYP